MSNYQKYEIISNNEIIIKELDKIIAYDKCSNLYVVGALNFFGTLNTTTTFKSLKKAIKHFNTIVL